MQFEGEVELCKHPYHTSTEHGKSDPSRGRYHQFEEANTAFPEFCRICGHHRDDPYVNHGDEKL